MLQKKIIKNLNLKRIRYLPTNISKLYFSIPKIILRLFFKFNLWHISSYRHRKYAISIVKHANAKEIRNKALEIGCGLGDIIRRLDYNTKVGLDNDVQVLKAARFVSKVFDKNKTDFNFYDLVNSDTLNEIYDVVLVPNFAHAISSEILKKKIEHIFLNNLSDSGEIILDVIEDKNLQNYRNFHSIDYLSESIECEIYKIGEFKHSRTIYSISKKSNHL